MMARMSAAAHGLGCLPDHIGRMIKGDKNFLTISRIFLNMNKSWFFRVAYWKNQGRIGNAGAFLVRPFFWPKKGGKK